MAFFSEARLQCANEHSKAQKQLDSWLASLLRVVLLKSELHGPQFSAPAAMTMLFVTKGMRILCLIWVITSNKLTGVPFSIATCGVPLVAAC
jgi:hypothetical protein